MNEQLFIVNLIIESAGYLFLHDDDDDNDDKRKSADRVVAVAVSSSVDTVVSSVSGGPIIGVGSKSATPLEYNATTPQPRESFNCFISSL